MIDFIVYRLREAGWISGHRFEADRGYVLEWTAKGRQRALLLQDLVTRHELTVESRARRFTAICRTEERAPWGKLVPTVQRDFWRICVEELQLGMEETSLATFARMIAAWQCS